MCMRSQVECGWYKHVLFAESTCPPAHGHWLVRSVNVWNVVASLCYTRTVDTEINSQAIVLVCAGGTTRNLCDVAQVNMHPMQLWNNELYWIERGRCWRETQRRLVLSHRQFYDNWKNTSYLNILRTQLVVSLFSHRSIYVYDYLEQTTNNHVSVHPNQNVHSEQVHSMVILLLLWMANEMVFGPGLAAEYSVMEVLPMMAFPFVCGHWMDFFCYSQSNWTSILCEKSKHSSHMNMRILSMFAHFILGTFALLLLLSSCGYFAGKKMIVGEIFYSNIWVGNTNYPYWAWRAQTAFQYQTMPLPALYDQQTNPKFPSILSAWMCQSKNCWKLLNKQIEPHFAITAAEKMKQNMRAIHFAGDEASVPHRNTAIDMRQYLIETGESLQRQVRPPYVASTKTRKSLCAKQVKLEIIMCAVDSRSWCGSVMPFTANSKNSPFFARQTLQSVFVVLYTRRRALSFALYQFWFSLWPHSSLHPAAACNQHYQRRRQYLGELFPAISPEASSRVPRG